MVLGQAEPHKKHSPIVGAEMSQRPNRRRHRRRLRRRRRLHCDQALVSGRLSSAQVTLGRPCTPFLAALFAMSLLLVIVTVASAVYGQLSQQADNTIATAQLVSAKGALALWRNSATQQQQTSSMGAAGAAAGSGNAQLIQQQQETGGLNQARARQQQLFYAMLLQVCFHGTTDQTGEQQQQQQRRLMLHAPQLPHYELIGVEGSTVKLNFVISVLLPPSSSSPIPMKHNNISRTMLYGEFAAAAAAAESANLNLDPSNTPHLSASTGTPPASPSSSSSFVNQRLPLKLEWFRADNELQVPVNQALNQPQLDSTRFTSSRFSSRQLASNVIPFANNSALKYPFLGTSNLTSDYESHANTGDEDIYLLAPYVNERQLARLDAKHLSPLARMAKTNALKHRQQHQRPHHTSASSSTGQLNAFDDVIFGPSIDWHRLERYLIRNNVDNDSFVCTPSQQHSSHPSSAAAQQPQIQHHLSIIQLDIARLSTSDSSTYKLRLCQSSNSATNQQVCYTALTFTLTVAEDVPQLEAWPETQLLEPGDRLTIKCQATGFTLPQISWFLDGMQLSEPPSSSSSPSSSIAAASSNQLSLQLQQQVADPSAAMDLDAFSFSAETHQRYAGSAMPFLAQSSDVSAQMAAHGSLLRVGDYVSQDNRVHSFVNASQVRHTDGGFYKCHANNGFHLVEREARIDVRAQPNIVRRLANASALNGAHRFTMQCPYSGYPIASIEWYFRPAFSSSDRSIASSPSIASSSSSSSSLASDYELGLVRNVRARSKRVTASASGESGGVHESTRGRLSQIASADPNREPPSEPDPDQDEWLSQASSMTQGPLAPEDYPEPMPDYPVLASEALDYVGSAAESPSSSSLDLSASADIYDDELAHDYADIPMDLQQQQQQSNSRRKRQVTQHSDQLTAAGSHWLKLPQSRHHQVHLNGTLVLNDISHNDQGHYKCRVYGGGQLQHQSSDEQSIEVAASNGSPAPLISSGSDSNSPMFVESNEMSLTVLVPPVISPFSSAESLREGMRNFLTCSVIEGDAPIRLRWLKDGRRIEEHIEQFGHTIQHTSGAAANGSSSQLIQMRKSISSQQQQQNQQQHQPRIRVETSNEYTSTLYFSYVDYIDNGNYTCMATNKAASVNYTTKMLVNVPPKWIKNPKDIECVAGQSIVIDCQAEAHPSPRIWWEIGVHTEQQQSNSLKNGLTSASLVDSSTATNGNSNNDPNKQQQQTTNLIPPNHYRTIISNSRIHILENASLVIRDVTKLDQGYYLCQAANNFGSLSALVKLTVNIAATFSSKHAIKHVRLNDHVELDCDPSGQSPITATWYMRTGSAQQPRLTGPYATNPTSGSDAAGLQMMQSSLSSSNRTSKTNQIIGTRFHQNQTIFGHSPDSDNNNNIINSVGYVASAAIGNGEENSALLGLGRRLFSSTVRTELPIISKTNSQHQQKVSQMDMSTMLMAGQQQQQHHPVEIDSSMSFELVRNKESANELLRLHIKQARRAHSVDFVCRVENQFGTDEKLIKLLVQEPPDLVQDLQAVQIDSRSVSIIWSVPYNGNAQIISYTVEWVPLATHTGTIQTNNPANHQQQARNSNVHIESGSSIPNGIELIGSGSTSSGLRNNRSIVSDPLLVVGSTATTTTLSKHQSVKSHAIVQQPAKTITGLEPMTSYEIQVRAHNQLGYSPYSTVPLIVTTTEEAPSAPPSDIRAQALSSTSLQLTWLAPPSFSWSIVGQSSPPSSSSDAISESDLRSPYSTRPSNRYTIKGYYIGYKIANSSDSYIFKTVSLLDNIDLNPEMLNLVTTGASFMNRAGGIKNGSESLRDSKDRQHSNHLHPSTSSMATYNNIEQPNRFKVVIGDLKRATKYSLIVQAYNSAGSGPQSDPLEARTLLNDPPPALMLNARMLTYTSIELQWSFEAQDTTQSSSLLRNSNSDTSANEIGFVSYSNYPATSLSPNNIRFAHHLPQTGTTTAPPTATTSPSATTNHRAKELSRQQKSQADSSSETEQEEESVIDGYHLYYRPIESGSSAPMIVDWLEKTLSAKTHSIIATGMAAYSSSQLPHPTEYTIVGNDVTRMTTAAAEPKQQTGGKSISNNVVPWNKIRFNESNNSTATFLSNKSFKYILDQLSCGTSYQIYVIAYNSYGSGQPSQVVRAKTRGSAPIAPRKHDFIRLNSTYVVLNIDVWSDGGCSLKNFEIRHRQLGSRAEAINNVNNEANDRTQLKQPQQQWILLSNTISPDQRYIELRDLQPETWYTILVKAESVAGSTEAQYVFMTLDRYGRIPMEAVEPLEFLNGTSLFRGNLSLMSILHNLSNPYDGLSPLLISTSLCLILFAFCSVYYIRRYSAVSNANKDNLSIDSRTTTGATMSTATVGAPALARPNFHQHHLDLNHGDDLDHHHHHHQLPASHYHDHGLESEHYSMKVSPRKSSLTPIPGSSGGGSSSTTTTTNGSSALLLGNTNNTATMCPTGEHNIIRNFNTMDPQRHNNTCGSFQQQQQLPIGVNKFSTMSRESAANHTIADVNVYAQHLNRFKTLPHHLHQRPVSTFLSPANTDSTDDNNNSNTGNGTRQVLANLARQQHNAFDEYGVEISDSQQQQIYSKLRMLGYQLPSNYDLSAAFQQAAVDSAHKNQVQQEFNDLYSTVNNLDSETLNLALSNQKLVSCNLRRQLKDLTDLATSDPYGFSPPTMVQVSHHQALPETQLNDHLGSDIHSNECRLLDQNGHLVYEHQSSSNQKTQGSDIDNHSSGCNGAATSSAYSSSMSAIGSSQQQSDMSQTNQANQYVRASCEQTNPNIKPQNNQNTCPNLSHQQQAISNQQNGSGHQSDYALPFPPKWV